jgi:hypothetical protein
MNGPFVELVVSEFAFVREYGYAVIRTSSPIEDDGAVVFARGLLRLRVYWDPRDGVIVFFGRARKLPFLSDDEVSLGFAGILERRPHPDDEHEVRLLLATLDAPSPEALSAHRWRSSCMARP